MIKFYFYGLPLLYSLNVFASENFFMKEYFSGIDGRLINVMSPCAPGCVAEIEIKDSIIRSPTAGIDWDELYSLEEDKDNFITLMYSETQGPYVIHKGSKNKFSLVGPVEHHPIDYALRNCYSIPSGQTTAGINNCLWGAELAWNIELNRVYDEVGGSSNIELRKTQLAWIKFRDAQFEWFNTAFGKRHGSKWSYGIAKRRVELLRQQVERLQSFYEGS